MVIDYSKLSKAQSHYEDLGYVPVDVPWWVSKSAAAATFEGDPAYEIRPGKHLIASGEQGFLYMIMKGMLPAGRYQTVTPCFRNEVQGPMHRKGFMKLELIDTKYVNIGTLSEMLCHAVDFFRQYVPEVIYTDSEAYLAQPNTACDLTCSGHELGSYGIRSYLGIDWVYGTGCAEPRLSNVVQAIRGGRVTT